MMLNDEFYHKTIHFRDHLGCFMTNTTPLTFTIYFSILQTKKMKLYD